MPTGYEVDMYGHIRRSAEALEQIADALERIADALEGSLFEPPPEVPGENSDESTTKGDGQ